MVSTGVETVRPSLPAALVVALLLAAPTAAASVTKPSLPARDPAPAGPELSSGPGAVVLVLPLTGPEDAEPDWLSAGAARLAPLIPEWEAAAP